MRLNRDKNVYNFIFICFAILYLCCLVAMLSEAVSIRLTIRATTALILLVYIKFRETEL